MPKPSWSGAASGAATGASMGAMFGPWGAAIGGVGGGILGLFTGGNKKNKVKNHSTLTPEQQAALQQLYSQPINQNPLYKQGSSYLQNLLSNNPQAYQAFEAPYMQNFEQNIVPTIAERFAGMGSGAGAASSSALNQSLAQAGRGLQTDLAALRSNLQMQALPQALGYAQQPYSNLLQSLGIQAFQPYERPEQPNFLTQAGAGIFQGFGQAAGQGAGNAFGNYISKQWGG